jgi:hypothetical protein
VTTRDAFPAVIEVAAAPDGSLFYAVQGSPAALPAVRARDLLACWAAAHRLATAGSWGVCRQFRFITEAAPIDIALSDADARCWADAVDTRASLSTRYGLSLCLRLLALIDLLTHSPSARTLVSFDAGEAELHPTLVAAAAALPLDGEARFSNLDGLTAPALAGASAACQLLSAPLGPRS